MSRIASFDAHTRQREQYELARERLARFLMQEPTPEEIERLIELERRYPQGNLSFILWCREWNEATRLDTRAQNEVAQSLAQKHASRRRVW